MSAIKVKDGYAQLLAGIALVRSYLEGLMQDLEEFNPHVDWRDRYELQGAEKEIELLEIRLAKEINPILAQAYLDLDLDEDSEDVE